MCGINVVGGGGAVSPPAGSGAAPQTFENYAYNEASFAHFDNNCSGKILTSNL